MQSNLAALLGGSRSDYDDGRDPEGATLRRRRRMSDSLIQQSMNVSDVRTPMSAWGKIAQALAGSVTGYMADREGEQLNERRRDGLAKAEFLVGGGQPSGPMQHAAPLQSGPMAAPEPSLMPEPVQRASLADRLMSGGSGAAPLRGEAPRAVSDGIAARRALDPNAPDYFENIQRINNGVMGQTMPGARPQPISADGGAPPAAPPASLAAMLTAPADAPHAAPGRPSPQQQLETLMRLTGRGNPLVDRMAAQRIPLLQAEIQREDGQTFRREEREFAERARMEQIRETRRLVDAGRTPPAPSEFTRMLGEAGIAPGSPEAQAFARSVLEQRGRPPSTNVNVDSRQMGTIPPGFRAEYDEAGRIVQLVPIPGGPASLDADKTDAAAVSRRAGTARSGAVVTQDIDRALGRLDQAILPVTGLGAGTLAGIAGTGAADVRALLESVKANTGFAALSQMRSESPTGAALGAVTERELSLLQSVLGSVEQSQSPTQFRENLVRLRQIYGEIINGSAASAPAARPAAPPASPPAAPRNGGMIQRAQDRNAARPMSEAEYRAAPSGTRFTAPDGSQRIKP